MNQLTLHKELIDNNHSKNKILALSANMLDFGFTEALQMSPVQEVEVRN